MSTHACPQCGGSVETDSRFCKHCAFDLSKPATESEATIVTAKPRQPARRSRTLFFAGVGIVSLLVLGIIGGYIYKRYRAQAGASTNSAPTPSGPIVSDRAKQVEAKILRGETLSESDIAGLSPYELRVLRNAHFARYGRKYDQTGELGSYFYTRPWYKPSDSYNDNMITSADKANIKLILALEQASSTIASSSTTTTESSSTASPNQNAELTRDLALSLIRGQMTKMISAGMMDTGQSHTQTYNEMIQANIISCEPVAYISWHFCKPGPNGKKLNLEGHYLWVSIGQMVPSVTGISKESPTAVIAAATVAFQPGSDYQFYARWQAAFVAWGKVGEQPVYQFAEATRSEEHSVHFRLFDNGWRVEKIE